MKRLIRRKLYLVIRIAFGISILLLHSCKEKQEPIIEENVLDLEQIHIDSILSKYTVLEHTKQFNFSSFGCAHASLFGFYDIVLNPYLYKKENKEYTSAPGLEYPFPDTSINDCPPTIFKDSIYIEYNCMETMFYLKDFRTKKRAVLEEKFEVSYAINEFYLYYPKLITFGVAEVSIYDLETHEKLKANALKRVPNVYFDYSNKDRYSLYNLNEGFGWGAKYHKKDDTSCFIVGFRELVTDNEISYLVSINPHNDQITVYDSINYRHPDTTNWSTIPIDIWHYSKAIGLVYSLGDSAYKIKDLEHRPFKKVKLRIPNPDIESVNSKYTITRGSICLDSSKMHLNFQIFQTNDFSLVKRIDKTIKILSPEMIKEGFMGKKMIFDKYLFVPYKINHITNDKWDYMVYDISQNKLKRLVGISHLDSVFEDDQNSYLYIPNKGIFLSKK